MVDRRSFLRKTVMGSSTLLTVGNVDVEANKDSKQVQYLEVGFEHDTDTKGINLGSKGYSGESEERPAKEPSNESSIHPATVKSIDVPPKPITVNDGNIFVPQSNERMINRVHENDMVVYQSFLGDQAGGKLSRTSPWVVTETAGVSRPIKAIRADSNYSLPEFEAGKEGVKPYIKTNMGKKNVPFGEHEIQLEERVVDVRVVKYSGERDVEKISIRPKIKLANYGDVRLTTRQDKMGVPVNSGDQK